MTHEQQLAFEEAVKTLKNMSNEDFAQLLSEAEPSLDQKHDYIFGGVLPSCNCHCHKRYS